MTQEEKAKAYDKIIEKANKMHHENCEACQICIEELIPELKESEDEKMRKALISFLKSPFVNENITDEKVTPWIAWLEKQSKASNVEESMREVEEKAKAFTETHKGETSEEILAQMKGEQKPAWSEEDLYKIENALFGTYAVDVATKLLNRIKSLRPQNTWKPSDEQMIAISTAIGVLGQGTLNGKQLIELREELQKLREEDV